MKANISQNDLIIDLDNTRIIKTIASIYNIIYFSREQKNILIFLINIIPYLQKTLKIQVYFYIEIIGNRILCLLNKENIISLKEEDGNEVLAKQLGDVNDAFVQTTIKKELSFLPSLICFWFLMYKEFRALKYFVIDEKNRGAKISSIIDLLVKILPLIDHLLIASGMARIGYSILDYYKIKSFREKVHVYLPILPINVIIADAMNNMNNDANIKEQFAKIKKGWVGLDIVRIFIYEYITVINHSHGPLRGFSMVGGGDYILSRNKYNDKISYISTGGVLY